MSCRETTEGLCSTTRRLKQWFGEKVRAKATPPRVERHDPNYFQPEEIAAILEALETEPLKWQLITHLMIVTGCRRGEIMGPQWEKVDFENNRVKIDKSLVSTKSKGTYLGNTKTSDIRYLTLPDETMNLLRQHKVEQMRLQIANGDRWQNTGFVFTTDDGSNMNPDSITGWLCDFSRRHNLPHINPHAFRHPYVKHTTKNFSCKSRNPKPSNILRWSGIPAFSITEWEQILNRTGLGFYKQSQCAYLGKHRPFQSGDGPAPGSIHWYR